MPLFSANENCEYTLIPNWFLIDYMKKAPGEYLKVYLYGRFWIPEKSENNFKDFCSQLEMPYDDVVCAFEYWQQQGLVKIKNDKNISFEYLKPEKASAVLYTEQEYNLTLQKLFGSRVLTTSDYQKIYDYTDTFKLPKDLVPLLLEYCVKMKGKDISFSYIDKIAKTWSEEGVDTVSEACAKIERFEAITSDAGRVLKFIGILDRPPTPDEMSTVEKWIKEWGFTLDAIKTACSKTISSRNPSIKYLDSILKRLYERNILTSRQICTDKNIKEDAQNKIKEILYTLGLSSHAVSLEHLDFYNNWTTLFAPDVILLAAKQAAQYSVKNLNYLNKTLDNWHKKGLKTKDEIEKYLQDLIILDKKIENIFKLAGIRKSIAESDRQKYIQWTKESGFPVDVIHLACEISSVTENPYKYLDKLLSIWQQKNIKTFETASQEAKRTNVKPLESRKNNAESLKYIQRNNKGKDLTFLYANFREDVEEN